MSEEQTKMQPLDSKELPTSPIDPMVKDALSKEEKPLTDEQQIYKAHHSALYTFMELVRNYTGSKKQLQRVMMNLAISPLNAEQLYFDPNYPQEKELFDAGTSVNSSKFFLMLAGMQSQGKISFTETLVPDSVTEEVPVIEDFAVLEEKTMEKE